MDRKKQIEQLYTDALYNDEAPNVFADRILSLFGVVVSGACKCDIPDPFKMMPYKCFRCHGKIEISETELCDNPHCEDGIVDSDMYGHPIYCEVCDKHN